MFVCDMWILILSCFLRRQYVVVRQENRVLIVTTCGDSGIAAGMGGTGSRM